MQRLLFLSMVAFLRVKFDTHVNMTQDLDTSLYHRDKVKKLLLINNIMSIYLHYCMGHSKIIMLYTG